MPDNQFSIEGKILSAYSTKDPKSYSPKEIGEFLRKFQAHEALRLIGEVSDKYIYRGASSVYELKGVPISDGALSYLAMRLIEHSNDFRSNKMDINDLLQAIHMYYGLKDPVEEDEAADPCLIRFGSISFDYQRNLNNLLARTLLLYRDLWTTVPEARSINIQNVLQQLTGLSLEETWVLSQLFLTRIKDRGFFRIRDDDLITSQGKQALNLIKQNSFVKWLSCDYSTFKLRAKEALQSAPSVNYEKHRFNPLIKHPIISPKCNPEWGAARVYLTPIPHLLYERVTRGLYFDFSDSFKKDGKRNDFRASFGFVFQRYVGNLFEKAVEQSQILSEQKYGKPSKMSPDWLIVQNETAILVEVKQSVVYQEAKSWGDLEEVRKGLKQTIAHGVKQLWNFEKDIHSGKHKELEFLRPVKHVERIILTYDQAYFANSVLKEQICKILEEEELELPQNYYWHTLSIDELEVLLGVHGVDLFNTLWEKRLDPLLSTMDFRDFLARKHSEKPLPNPYLASVEENFLHDVKVDFFGE